MTGTWASEWELPPLLVLSRHEGWCCLGQLLCPGWGCRTVFSHLVHSGDLVNCREVEGGPTALLMELFFGECPPFAVRRLELPLEYFSLLFGVRNKVSFFLQWGDPYVGWLLVLNVSPKEFVLGGLLRVGIFKGCVQVGPVCSLQLALDFSSELFAQDLQFHCALLPHLPEDMVPPWWAGEWRVGEIQGLLSLTRACLCGLQSLIAVRRVSLNRVHIFSEVAESFSGSILSARSVMALLSWSQSAFLYSGMSLGTCFLFRGWMITSQCTASWSEGPGRTCILGMSCGLLGMIRSRVLSRCVGSSTSCSRP